MEYSGIFQKSGIFHFLPFFVCPGFFLEYSTMSHIPDFRTFVCPIFKMEYSNIPRYPKKTTVGMSQIFFGILPQQYPKKHEFGYVPDIFWDIPIFQIFALWVCPKLNLEYSGIFREKWNIPEYD